MDSPDPLRVTVEPLEDARLIRADGEVDMSSAPALRHELEATRVDAVTTLLDLAEVTFIDSTGLHLLLDASRSAADGNDWSFFVRPLSRLPRRV
jgi:anti-sigma B factor antagonist